MDSQSLNERSFISNPAWRRWLIAIGVVWGGLAIIYAFVAIQTRNKQRQLTTSGISMIRTFSQKAGLPLLDQDINNLRNMLVDIGKQPEVLYASVVDHKNKIIAYTDAVQVLPPRKTTTSDAGGVETWLDKDAMIFSSAIMFSGTPIGEIRLALSRASIVRSKRAFAVIVAISLIGLVIVSLFLHGRKLLSLATQWRFKNKSEIDVRLLLCPLCGQDVGDGGSFCHAGNDIHKGFILRLSGALPGGDGSSGLGLSEIGSNPRLASIKGQMIQQCAEIISKLSVNDGCPGSQARENLR